MSRESRLAAESEARAVLSAALADYRHDPVQDRDAADHVLAELQKLAQRIAIRHRSDREAMRTARGFARLARLHPRLVELFVACREMHDRSGEIEPTVDVSPLLADLQNPGRWSSSHRALFAAYDAEQWRAFVAGFPSHGRREALVHFRRALQARGPCRPADLARVAGLVLSDNRGQRPARHPTQRLE
jgi:hypothetical protein